VGHLLGAVLDQRRHSAGRPRSPSDSSIAGVGEHAGGSSGRQRPASSAAGCRFRPQASGCARPGRPAARPGQ
jgi:hypothetical protein